MKIKLVKFLLEQMGYDKLPFKFRQQTGVLKRAVGYNLNPKNYLKRPLLTDSGTMLKHTIQSLGTEVIRDVKHKPALKNPAVWAAAGITAAAGAMWIFKKTMATSMKDCKDSDNKKDCVKKMTQKANIVAAKSNLKAAQHSKDSKQKAEYVKQAKRRLAKAKG